MRTIYGSLFALTALAVSTVGCASDVEEEPTGESSQAVGTCAHARTTLWDVEDVARVKEATCWTQADGATVYCTGTAKEISLRKYETLTAKAFSPKSSISNYGKLAWWQIVFAPKDEFAVSDESAPDRQGTLSYSATRDIKVQVILAYAFRVVPGTKVAVPRHAWRQVELKTCP